MKKQYRHPRPPQPLVFVKINGLGLSSQIIALYYLCSMIDKQQDTAKETKSQPTNILDLYNIPANNIHYTLHNLFRGLKSIRRKYHLTLNEIIFLNAMYLYCKNISTCMSQDACLKFIGYYNLNKVKYYLGSLHNKNMIQIAEVIKGYNHYRLTQLGISVIEVINGSFERCLYEWFNKYSICL
jgi:hypothetical protein